jgi:uncharacterized tellurite resistance protein B-like protein
MIEFLKSLLNPDIQQPVERDPKQLAIAATALMVQVAQVDGEQDERELQIIVDCAVKAHHFNEQEACEIVDDALNQAESATSLYEFTEALNHHLSQDDKYAVLENIWRVAFADGRIDKYEEHLIRRIAELLHLNHREYIQARHRAEAAQ